MDRKTLHLPLGSLRAKPACLLAQDMMMLDIDLETKCIFLLELLAVCIGFWLWGDVFGVSSLVAFTDNEAAKACLVKGSSAPQLPTSFSFVAVLEVERMCLPWFFRVLSLSNIALCLRESP